MTYKPFHESFGIFDHPDNHPMEKNTPSLNRYGSLIVQLASISISIIGSVVLIGWFLDISPFKTVIPGAPSMKFSTSLSFICTGIVLFFISEFQSPSRRILSASSQVVLPAALLVIILFMSTHLASSVLGNPSGLDNLFVKEGPSMPQTAIPGRPSEGTILNFMIIAAAGIISIREQATIRKPLLGIGITIGIVAGIALIGFASSIPTLFYFIDGVANGMSIHTAILFLAVAVTLVILSKSMQNNPWQKQSEGLGKARSEKRNAKITVRTKLTSLIIISSVIPTIYVAAVGLSNASSIQAETLVASLGILGLASTVSVTMIALLYSKSLLDPVLSLRQAMNKIAGGDFNVFIPVEGTDEIGELARDIGVMKDAVIARNANLEKLVRLRNMELEHSNEHIELMHKELESVNNKIKKLESRNRKLYDDSPDLYRTENTER